MYDSADLNMLDRLIQDSAKVPLIQKYDKFQVILTEDHGINYQVPIIQVPKNTLVIKSDKFPTLKDFFQGNQGECKRADYILISDDSQQKNQQKNQQKFMIFIEMKAGKAIEKEVIQQLKGAECLIAYCQKIGQLFWDSPNFLTGYEYRFVSLKHINIPKRSTREKPSPQKCDRPENMLKIYSPSTLLFNRLIGN